MDGTVQVVSAPDSGSTFVVELQLPRAHPNALAGPDREWSREHGPAPAEEAPDVAVTPPIPNTAAPIDPTLDAVPVLNWRSRGTFQDRDLECAEVLVPCVTA